MKMPVFWPAFWGISWLGEKILGDTDYTKLWPTLKSQGKEAYMTEDIWYDDITAKW